MTFHSRPSQLLNLEDEYTAYCFDEACAYIYSEIQDGKKAKFEEDKKENAGLKLLLG